MIELLVAEVDVVGWGVIDVMVDEENGTCCWGNGISIRSLSHDMILYVALDLQNLHIHFVHSFP